MHIENSYLVTSKYDRQKVSLILTRMDGITPRDYDSLSAEWSVHNTAYHVIPSWSSWKERAKHVDLDFGADSRWYVISPSRFYEIMGWD